MKKEHVSRMMEKFKNMNTEPIFEIEQNGEYHIFYIICNENGLEAGGASNIGFMPINKKALSMGWDEDFSLDEHLQVLHEMCVEYIMSESRQAEDL